MKVKVGGTERPEAKPTARRIVKGNGKDVLEGEETGEKGQTSVLGRRRGRRRHEDISKQ
jgi:hypothetical protein